MTSIEYTGYNNLILCVSVWAEDTWLQEHAGETITEQEKEKGEKRSAVSDTVCKEFSVHIIKKSGHTRKPTNCICEKDADQLRSTCKANQCLLFLLHS